MKIVEKLRKYMPSSIFVVVVIAMLIFAFIASLVLVPFVLIWALNTLFPALAIAYSFKVWVATVIVLVFAKLHITFRA